MSQPDDGGVAVVLKTWQDVDALRAWAAARLDALNGKSTDHLWDTASHFKWLLAADAQSGTRIWLHEFKGRDDVRAGYAGTIHNHRYRFQSVVLVGGYVNASYDVTFDHDSLKIIAVRLVEQVDTDADVTYSMDPYEFHSIREVESGTQSLVVEFPARLTESYSVNEAADRMIRHVPPEVHISQRPHLSARLRASIGADPRLR